MPDEVARPTAETCQIWVQPEVQRLAKTREREGTRLRLPDGGFQIIQALVGGVIRLLRRVGIGTASHRIVGG